MKFVLTQSSLDALCEKFHILYVVHPELPGHNDRIHNSLVGKIDVYSRFFDFANYRIPLSQFIVDILEYFQINLSQLSVIAAAKVSHFEILCRVHGFVPTVEMDLFAFINHADPTKGAGNDDVNKEGNDAAEADQTEQVERIRKKRKDADGVGGSGLPPKKLREDHGTSGISASSGGKSVADLQSLLDSSTLAAEMGATAGATIPFVTSSVTPTSEREGGGLGDSVTGPNLRTQLAFKRFVVLTDSSHHSSTL
ncbi:hypothetical protein Tco_0919307, partial [Tanacetum coccineum]